MFRAVLEHGPSALLLSVVFTFKIKRMSQRARALPSLTRVHAVLLDQGLGEAG